MPKVLYVPVDGPPAFRDVPDDRHDPAAALAALQGLVGGYLAALTVDGGRNRRLAGLYEPALAPAVLLVREWDTAPEEMAAPVNPVLGDLAGLPLRGPGVVTGMAGAVTTDVPGWVVDRVAEITAGLGLPGLDPPG